MPPLSLHRAGVCLTTCALAITLAALAPGNALPRRAEQAKSKSAAPQGAADDPAVIDASGYVEILARHRGKPVMVNFWATWCEPCREEYPMVNELARAYSPKGLVVIAVSLDDDSAMAPLRAFLAQKKPVFTNYRKKPGNDERFINSVDVKWSGAVPATFFYAADGRLAAKLVGEFTRDTFEKALREKLGLSAPVSHTSTR